MAIDRRVARTQAMLHQALFSLILDEGYEAISIKDICDRANVGRTTFYAHYTGKDDLKRSGLDHLRNTLLQRHRGHSASAGGQGGPRLGFSLPMFEHARDHLHLYRALVGGHGGAIALETIREILSDLVRDELGSASRSADEVPRDVAVRYIVGGYMAILTSWLDAGAGQPPGEMDSMFRRLAVEGFGAVGMAGEFSPPPGASSD